MGSPTLQVQAYLNHALMKGEKGEGQRWRASVSALPYRAYSTLALSGLPPS